MQNNTPLFLWLLLLLTFSACSNEPSPTTTTSNPSRVERLPYYNDASFTPQWLPLGDQEVTTLHRISPFQLSNQDGKTITDRTFDKKIYVADFFFTSCPGICPRMTDNMLILQEAFIDDDEVLLLSHSVTPKRDSVPVLKDYAIQKGVISCKWHLVTGARSDVYHLGRKEYFVEENLGLQKDEDEFLHTENFVLVDKDKHIRGIYNGLNKSSINQLIADIKTLKREK